MICSSLYTALITPFDQKGEVDYEGFSTLIERQKKGGVEGILIFGTTGEGSTLKAHEKIKLMQLAREEAGALSLMVNCGAYSTEQCVINVVQAQEFGADAALVISPFYVKPTQEGLFRHFEAVTKTSSLPIMIYNHPGRTSVNIELETLKRITDLPTIIGIKETSGNLARISEIVCAIKKNKPPFLVLAGDDDLLLATLAVGGDGIISVASNIFPKKIVEMIAYAKSEDLSAAREIHLLLTPLFKALNLESNPIPLKAALHLIGLASNHLRLPLTPLSPQHLDALKRALFPFIGVCDEIRKVI